MDSKTINQNTDLLDIDVNEVDLASENNNSPKKVKKTDNKNKTKKDISVLDALKQKETIKLVQEAKEETPLEIIDAPLPKEKEEKKVKRYYNTPILEGLSSDIVAERIEANLVNRVTNGHGKSILDIILSNTFTFFNMLYLSITIIFLILKSYENLFFLATIIPNFLIGIYQEIKAKLLVDKLSLMSAPTTTVIRDKEKIEIPVDEVVLDDIVFYTPGKQICADSIVIEGFIEVNESLLTGESDAVLKNIGDELLSGSFVVSGVAVARVDKIGKDNYVEKLAKDAKVYQKPKSQLLRSLNIIIKFVSVIILPLAVLTYITTTNGMPKDFLPFLSRDGLIRAGSSVLAMIPAGLFLLTSVSLFYGVIRLANRKTLVQELYCIEMLARANVLCLDKTGTITDGTMRVFDCIELKNYTDYTIREIVGSMMSAFKDSNPTSEALIRFFDKNDVLEPTKIIPFSSKRKYSAVAFGEQGTFYLGAPEFVLQQHYDSVSDKVDRFTNEGNRVLILGHVSTQVKSEDLPRNIKPLALIVLQDHIREDAADTIDFFKQNSVDIKIISGDNPITVSQIAMRVGVEGAERYVSLAGMTDDEVRELVFDYTVFGRVSPDQKKIIIQTLKEHKKTVAMTGDGVNDILALKEADCSIAMASGSDAVRYASHLVLVDSNFSSMPQVVIEGRRVINNIQKTSTLFLVKTIFAILLTIMYIIFGMQNGPISITYPFTAKHLYMIEWFVLGIPTVYLALQRNREIVKGKFLSNVIKSTLPGALTVVILHLILCLLRITPGFESLRDNNVVFTTIATVVTTAVMMFVLFQVSHPFNWVRKIIYIAMIICCFLMGFNLIPSRFTKLELSYYKNIDELAKDIVIEVNDNKNWTLNGKTTPVRAVEKPNIENLFADTHLTPNITVSSDYFWCLNGIKTSINAFDQNHLVLNIVDKYWYINNQKTNVKAFKAPNVKYYISEEYRLPEITISENHWALDGHSTIIHSSVNELTLTVRGGLWWINDRETSAKAEKIPLNPDEYVIPNVTIEKGNFVINGILTDIPAGMGDDINLAVDEEGFWTINGIRTSVKAKRITDTDDINEYVPPLLSINRKGYWQLNGITTIVKADDALLIKEILITLLLVHFIAPLMLLISKCFKKLRIAPE
ncbi:MAG: HAD-IC family P-type ATPase [Bacilli bacterium]|nr:HAD-IC family P-type ATPase [Bacilli bacterium]